MFFSKSKHYGKRKTVTDFKSRGVFSGYRPIDYEEYEPFSNLKPTLDDHLKRLFTGEIDEANKDALDPIILDIFAQAEQDLNRQKIEHADRIHEINNRRSGDKLQFERQLEQLQADLAENKQALEEATERYEANKF